MSAGARDGTDDRLCHDEQLMQRQDLSLPCFGFIIAFTIFSSFLFGAGKIPYLIRKDRGKEGEGCT